MTYEAMFLLDSGYAAANWDACVKEVTNSLQRHNCEIIRLVKWDDRKLVYEIRQHKRGTYVLVYFRAPGEGVAKLERDVQLSENLLRVLVLKCEKMTDEMALRVSVPSGESNIIGENLPPPAPPAPKVAAVATDAVAPVGGEPAEGEGAVKADGEQA